MWRYFCILYCIPLIYLSTFLSIPYCLYYFRFIVSFTVFLSKNILIIIDPLNFYIHFRTNLWIPVWKKPARILILIALKLYSNLETVHILTILSLPFHEHIFSLHFLRSFRIYISSMFCLLQNRGLRHNLLNLALNILFFTEL